MDSDRPIFERIANLWTSAGSPLSRWQPSLEECVLWLDHKHLTRSVNTFQSDLSDGGSKVLSMGDRIQLGIPCQRAERRRKSDLDALKEQYNQSAKGTQPAPELLEAIWRELKDPKNAVRALNVYRLPADALAFYRPFHFSPHEEWGIYLLVDRLLRHCTLLYNLFKSKLAAFSLEALTGCVLFEVFHHEFFHHLTECAATTIEILSAGFGEPTAVYNDYWCRKFEQTAGLGRHPDHPLEEALANAYAYNSFSFISRMQIGYKLVWVKLYQNVLEKCWPMEPPGYRSASKYIKSGYVSGAAQLLAMLVSSAYIDPASVSLLAKAVMPNGNSAFLQKPDIPTYLVGTAEALNDFRRLVPTPNETYTSLFWLGDTSTVDTYLQNRKKQEEAEKKKRGLR
jgi:hypothetical protein